MGLFTRPKKTLEPNLFENNKLIPDIQNSLLHRAYTIFPKEKIFGLYIIGSSIGYTWEEDSDIDINLILTEDAAEGAAYWAPVAKEHNGELLEGTLHPVNFFVQNYRVPKWEDGALGVYDLINNKWAVAPPPPSTIPDIKKDDPFPVITADLIETRVQGLIKNLRKSYERFRMTKNQVWKDEMERYVEELLSLFQELDADRKAAYGAGVGTPRYSDENIIFKYLDRDELLHILNELNRYYDGSL